MSYDAHQIEELYDNKWAEERRQRFLARMGHKLQAKERRYSRT